MEKDKEQAWEDNRIVYIRTSKITKNCYNLKPGSGYNLGKSKVITFGKVLPGSSCKRRVYSS